MWNISANNKGFFKYICRRQKVKEKISSPEMSVGNWRQGDTEIEFCFAFVFTGSSQILECEFYSIRGYQSNEHGCVKAEFAKWVKYEVQIQVTAVRY